MKLELIEKTHEQDRDVYFCRFEGPNKKELRVRVTAQQLIEFKKHFGGDLEQVCRLAAEHSVSTGKTDGEVEIVGQTYLALKNALAHARNS